MKYLILGAGPAGLTAAYALLKKGIKDFCVLEDNTAPGGLCKSTIVNGSPLDIGGGHFLDSRNSKVLDIVFSLMPENEWRAYRRNSQIHIQNSYMNNPIESNLWQLNEDTQIEYLKSIATAGCNTGKPMPSKFTDWIRWKLGNRIADDYMLPYNKKMFGKELDKLGTYWLDKLPNVSFEESLKSCLHHKAYGHQPAHEVFIYPKEYGYGEIFDRMAVMLGDKLKLGYTVKKLDMRSHSVNDDISAENIIVTIPWSSLDTIVGIPYSLSYSVKRELKHTSIAVEYHHENIDTDAHWIYEPSPDLRYHRILVRHNFCPNSRGYWTESNMGLNEFKKKFCTTQTDEKVLYKKAFYNEYAYPLNTIDKPEIMNKLLSKAKSHNVYGLGRWGEWQHYNSDVVMQRAIDLIDQLTGTNK